MNKLVNNKINKLFSQTKEVCRIVQETKGRDHDTQCAFTKVELISSYSHLIFISLYCRYGA